MTDRKYTQEELEEQRAKEEAYREYLRLRQEAPKVSITETPYGASQLRRKQKEEEQAREAYQQARAQEKSRGRSERRPRRSSAGQKKTSRRQSSDQTRVESSSARRTHPAGQTRPEGARRAEGARQPRPEGAGARRIDTASQPRLQSESGQPRPSGQRSRAQGAGQLHASGQQPRPQGGADPRHSGGHSRKTGLKGRIAEGKAAIGRLRDGDDWDLDSRPMAENSTVQATRKRGQKAMRPGKRSPKRPALRKAVVILLAILVAALALFLGAFTVAANTLSKVGSLDIEKNNLGISEQAKDTLKDYKNIAILGVDSRDMSDDAESRSDAMVILSINKKTDEVKMFSVFRDTMLYLGEDHGLDKITHAYAYGGAEDTLYALNKNIDLNIDKAVVINWKTVQEIIDSLGGIEIDVQESELEELNKYIKNTAKNTDSEANEVEEAGKQTLDGVQAVTYARIRKDAVTGDYRRNERMKIVMATTFKKLKSADLMTIKKICDNALPQAKTNLSTTEMLKMGLRYKKYDMGSSTTGWPYDVEGWIGEAGGGAAWYGPPVTLQSNVEKLFAKFFGIKDYVPTQDVQSISEDISELTGLY